MDGAVREVNVMVIWKGLELLSANGGRFEINQLLFADDTALMAITLIQMSYSEPPSSV